MYESKRRIDHWRCEHTSYPVEVISVAGGKKKIAHCLGCGRPGPGADGTAEAIAALRRRASPPTKPGAAGTDHREHAGLARPSRDSGRERGLQGVRPPGEVAPPAARPASMETISGRETALPRASSAPARRTPERSRTLLSRATSVWG